MESPVCAQSQSVCPEQWCVVNLQDGLLFLLTCIRVVGCIDPLDFGLSSLHGLQTPHLPGANMPSLEAIQFSSTEIQRLHLAYVPEVVSLFNLRYVWRLGLYHGILPWISANLHQMSADGQFNTDGSYDINLLSTWVTDEFHPSLYARHGVSFSTPFRSTLPSEHQNLDTDPLLFGLALCGTLLELVVRCSCLLLGNVCLRVFRFVRLPRGSNPCGIRRH